MYWTGTLCFVSVNDEKRLRVNLLHTLEATHSRIDRNSVSSQLGFKLGGIFNAVHNTVPNINYSIILHWLNLFGRQLNQNCPWCYSSSINRKQYSNDSPLTSSLHFQYHLLMAGAVTGPIRLQSKTSRGHHDGELSVAPIITPAWSQPRGLRGRLSPKWHPIPHIAPYFWPVPIGR